MSKVRVAVAGLGKMGLSHLAMIRPHPDVDLVGVCDASGYVLDVLSKHTGVTTFTDYETMLDSSAPDAVVIATPSHLHASMSRAALTRGIHVFCEKPLFLDPADGAELSALAAAKGLVTQVGYHNKFVGAFQEVKRLLDAGAIGEVTDALAEAYGPVVLKPACRSWRTSRSSGGGCLYDYAAHPIDLLTWYLGEATSVSGSALQTIFSRETDDAVVSTLHFGEDRTAQLRANWSDESQRKMTTKISIWGTGGRIYADRQEIQVFLRGTQPVPEGYTEGWSVKYTTELTEAPWFYLRGEEYSAQLDEFVRRVADHRLDGVNTFASASATDRVIDRIARDAAGLPPRDAPAEPSQGDHARDVAPRRRTRAAATARGALRSARHRIGPMARSVRTRATRTISDWRPR
jgi:scyllo-inositol 2-dehydrogenase (NADP+)